MTTERPDHGDDCICSRCNLARVDAIVEAMTAPPDPLRGTATSWAEVQRRRAGDVDG